MFRICKCYFSLIEYIYKFFKKNKKKGPKVIVYNSRLDREREIRKEKERLFRQEHKKEIIALIVSMSIIILGTIIASIIILKI